MQYVWIRWNVLLPIKVKKKYQALLDIIYVPKNWNLFKIQWWHLISFSCICRYLFWTSFYTTLFFPINREIYPNEIYMLQIPKIWIRAKICDNYPSLMQDDARCKNDTNQQLIKITASLLSASDQYIPHEEFTYCHTEKTAV